MRRLRSLPVGLVLALAGLACAGDELSPAGKPAKYEEGQPPQFALWRDEEGFHLRVTTEGAPWRFKGTIAAKGGALEDVNGLDAANALKRGVEKKTFRGSSGTDRWALDEAGARIAFDFSTDKLEDGVDWKATAKVESLELDLELGAGGPKAPTRKDAARTFVGGKGAHPAAIPFTVSAKK